MRRLTSLTILAIIPMLSCVGQSTFADFTGTLLNLQSARTNGELDPLWNALVAAQKIPLVVGDSAAFLYRGQARSVTWMGDFNGWGSNKFFNNNGIRVPGTDLWILKVALPADARLDYKILLDDQRPILDPVNPFHQWSGVGGGSLNSELRMPAWNEDPITIRRMAEAPKGNVTRDLLFSSRALGYQVTYSVYTPSAYTREKVYPVIYVTDGYEYMHERMGNMIATLDNLIFLEKIEPAVVIFIDHREPVNRANNRRMQELAMNEKYFDFLHGEFLPAVENDFAVTAQRSHRAIVGTSIGGLSAAWASFSRPDLFDRVGIQSPAFWFKPEIYSLCEKSGDSPAKVFLSTGLIHDAEDASRKMRDILDKKSCVYHYATVNQGHSWGNWRDLIDDMLVYLFPKENRGIRE